MIYLGTFTFPSLPERISVSTGMVTQSYNYDSRRDGCKSNQMVRDVFWTKAPENGAGKAMAVP